MGKKILVVGAGLSGAVVARELAERFDVTIHIVDSRSHIAGNCHTEGDAKTGIMVHCYGPHIFNTSDAYIWEYVNRYCKMIPYINRVKTTVGNRVFSMPINLHTINQFYNTCMGPQEASRFIESVADDSIIHPENFEQKALKHMGKELYEAFFYGYTKKQWGMEPRDLPASILCRIPFRFDYNDNYYESTYQGIPELGYDDLVKNLLDHKLIELHLCRHISPAEAQRSDYDHVIWSGAIDEYFDYQLGRLGYRTVYWKTEYLQENAIGTAVMNYADAEVPYTRKIEHKYFESRNSLSLSSVVSTEYSKATEHGDIPYYPMRFGANLELYRQYEKLADSQDKTCFIGRLGQYQYLNMEQVIAQALYFVDRLGVRLINGRKV